LYPLSNDKNTSTPLDPKSIDLIVPNGATGSDTDGDGDIDKVVVPGEGIWTVDSTGKVTFVPDAGLVGNPTPLSYTVKETNGDKSNQATLSVIYDSKRPIAVVDKIRVTHYGSNIGTVIDNDIAGVGLKSAHTYQLVDKKLEGRRLEKSVLHTRYDNTILVQENKTIKTLHGTVSMALDGTYIYTPDADYNGPDEFDYMIIDTVGQKDPAVVDVDVDCASSQTSDGGDALDSMSIFMLLLLTVLIGLYSIRKEDARGEA